MDFVREWLGCEQKKMESILCTRRTGWRVQLFHQFLLGIISKGALRRLLKLARTILGRKRAKHVDD